MKKLIIVGLVTIFGVSCQKAETFTIDKNIDVKAALSTAQHKEYRNVTVVMPGVMFSKDITATGTAVVSWNYRNDTAWIPAETLSKKIHFKVVNNRTYYEMSDYWWPEGLIGLIGIYNMKIDSFALTTGNYNVTVVN